MGSLYLHQGGNLLDDSKNAKILEDVILKLDQAGARYIIGGDYNNSAEDVQNWINKKGVHARVLAQRADTYHSTFGSSNIDFFVISSDLTMVLSKPQIQHISVLAGHRPVCTGWTNEQLHRSVNVWR